MSLDEVRDFAIETAKGAGDIVMKYHQESTKLGQDWTAKQHFRTIADQESDLFIRGRIKEAYPSHNIYSEEEEVDDRGSKYSWVVDPIDGTIPFRFGMSDHFSVCIALAEEKEPILGVIYAPQRNELYVGVKGQGAFCNGERIKPLNEDNINRVIMGFDGGKETESFKRTGLIPFLDRLYSSEGISCLVSYGCASVPLGLVASGKLHSYGALSLEPWDMASGVVINREAGNKVTTIDGREWNLDEPSILVANPVLHGKLLDFLRDVN